MDTNDPARILENLFGPITDMTKTEDVKLVPSKGDPQYFNIRDLVLRHINGLLQQPTLTLGQIELLKALLGTFRT